MAKLKAGKQNVWKKFFSMLCQSKLPVALMLAALGLNLIKSQIDLLLPEKIAYVINTLLPDPSGVVPDATVAVVVETLINAFIIGIAGLLISTIATVIQNLAQQKIDRNMQKLAVKKLFHLQVSDVEKGDPRQMISRVTTDTAQISVLLLDIAIREIPRLYYMIMATIKLFTESDPILAWTMLASIPIYTLGSFVTGRMSFRRSSKVQWKIADLTARLAEKINNVAVIKSYNNQQKETDDGNRIIGELNKENKKMTWVNSATNFIQDMMNTAPLVLVVVVGASLILAGRIDAAMFALFYGLAEPFRTRVLEHSKLWVAIKTAQGATNRLAEILDLPDEIGHAETVVPGDIVFENVTFSYGDKIVLDNVSFTIQQGCKTAFVGYSGSGKSTALNLIERFYAPVSGKIMMNGVDIASLDAKSYRQMFTYVPQNAPGFSGTLRQMLSYGNQAASDAVILEAAAKVGLSDTIALLGGLDAEIGTNASNLSGGQRQKLCLVRALLSNRDFMLLDEATSALDVQATEIFQNEIDQKMAGKTQILVAHDLSTVRNADKILVFQDAKIIAEGTHAELEQTSPLYRELIGAKGDN